MLISCRDSRSTTTTITTTKCPRPRSANVNSKAVSSNIANQPTNRPTTVLLGPLLGHPVFLFFLQITIVQQKKKEQQAVQLCSEYLSIIIKPRKTETICNGKINKNIKLNEIAHGSN